VLHLTNHEWLLHDYSSTNGVRINEFQTPNLLHWIGELTEGWVDKNSGGASLSSFCIRCHLEQC
jgi:hypothetical protein